MALTEGRVAVGSVESFPEGSMHAVRVNQQDVLIVHQGGAFTLCQINVPTRNTPCTTVSSWRAR